MTARRSSSVLAMWSAAAALSAALSASSPAQARPCATMALLELSRRGALPPSADIGFLDRPDAAEIAATVDSAVAGHRIRVHRGNGVDESTALDVLTFADAAWTAQIDGAGFDEPVGDGAEGGNDSLDIFIVPLPPGIGAITVANEDADAGDGRHASPAFIQIDPTLPPALLEVYLHHEIQHALQFAVDIDDVVMFYEASAVFWEVRTQPSVDDWLLSVPDFQAFPELPLWADGALADDIAFADAPRYEYGAVLFALYLDEVHGAAGAPAGTILRELWNRMPQPDDVEENEPDFVDALAATVPLPLDEMLADFVGWRALVGPLSVVDDGPLEELPGSMVLQAAPLNASELDGSAIDTGGDDGPWPLGCAVFQVQSPGNIDAMPLEITASSIDGVQEVRLALLVVDVDNGALIERRYSSAPAVEVSESLSVTRLHTLQIAVCNAGDADADPDVEPVSHPIRLRVLRTDLELPDAGQPVVDAGVVDGDAGPVQVPEPPTQMCSCQSTPPASAPASAPSNAPTGRSARGPFYVLGIVAMMIALAIRGVRHARRQNLYKNVE